MGVDVVIVLTNLETIKQKIFTEKDFTKADELIVSSNALLDTKKQEFDKAAEAKKAEEEAAKNKGTVSGKIVEGATPLSSVLISLISGKTTVSSAKTDKNGIYLVSASAGKYTLSASRSGYNTFKKYNVEITAQKTTTVDISMSKAAPKTSGEDSTANSSYSRITVNSSRGSYLVDLMKLNLGAIKVVTDTAADGDCDDNCPVMSLSQYVSRNGGFAGINGTYFCPSDYSSCAGQVNSFFWKVYNTRLGKMINASNGLGEYDPFFAFDSSGNPHYFSSWASRGGFPVYAGINCKPTLVSGGQYIVNEGSLDDKQRTSKITRGALGLKGKTVYAAIIKGATVMDSASVMQSLGVDYALNIDGGGSSAMIYKGGYKVGPGRGLPNAVIFVGQ